MKYVCSICGYLYDEAKEGTPFASLPDSWVCPLCGAAKSAFLPEETPKSPKAPVPAAPLIQRDGGQLSAVALSALCSNLGRGCEKQYREEEVALFREIADYFAAAAPAVPDAEPSQLTALFREDLTAGYPTLSAAAAEEGDRGTQRICVWGEKVTNIQQALMQRWEREGDALLQDTEIWVCSVCGFLYIGDAPPELCPVCKVPAWKFDKTERRAAL